MWILLSLLFSSVISGAYVGHEYPTKNFNETTRDPSSIAMSIMLYVLIYPTQ